MELKLLEPPVITRPANTPVILLVLSKVLKLSIPEANTVEPVTFSILLSPVIPNVPPFILIGPF